MAAESQSGEWCSPSSDSAPRMESLSRRYGTIPPAGPWQSRGRPDPLTGLEMAGGSLGWSAPILGLQHMKLNLKPNQ